MKKVLKVFVGCIIAILITFYIKNNNINILSDVTQKIDNIDKEVLEGSVSVGNEVKDDEQNSNNNITSENTNSNNISSNLSYTSTYNIKINKLQINNSTYYYSLITSNQQYIYTQIANAVKNYDEYANCEEYTFVSEEQTREDVSVAMEAFFADHPEVFYIDNTYYISLKNKIFSKKLEIQLVYLFTKDEIIQKIDVIDNKINSYLSYINDNMSNFQKELTLHDKLGEEVDYYEYTNIEDIPILAHTIYGAFVNKNGVCDSFAKALQILLDRVGIENIFVTGTLDNVSHAWNIVNMDGNYYHVDLTSNKVIKEKINNKNVVSHVYFNVNDEMIKKTHIIDKVFKIPQSLSNTYDYYNYYNSHINSDSNIKNKLKDILARQQNSKILEFSLDESINSDNVISEALFSLDIKQNNSGNKATINYYHILNRYLIIK